MDQLSTLNLGINNLKTTYSDDTFFCCSIDTYVQTIKAKLTQLQTSNPELFINNDEKKDDKKDNKLKKIN